MIYGIRAGMDFLYGMNFVGIQVQFLVTLYIKFCSKAFR